MPPNSWGPQLKLRPTTVKIEIEGACESVAMPRDPLEKEHLKADFAGTKTQPYHHPWLCACVFLFSCPRIVNGLGDKVVMGLPTLAVTGITERVIVHKHLQSLNNLCCCFFFSGAIPCQNPQKSMTPPLAFSS